MASSRFRFGLAFAVNGLAVAALAAAMVSDGADLQAALGRAYLVLMVMAPVAICLLLALTPMHRGTALKGAVIGACAVLLAASFDLPGDLTVAEEGSWTVSPPGQLAHH